MAKKRKDKWAYEESVMLFKFLVMKFGAYSEWSKKTFPKNAKEYDDFCEDLAELFGAKSSGAIKQQVAFAYTSQGYVKPSQATTWFRNKAAALSVGFITEKDLPTHVVCEC